MSRIRIGIAALTVSALAALVMAPAGVAATANPTNLSFGPQKVGKQSAVQQVVITGATCPDLQGPMGTIIPGSCPTPLDVAVSGDFTIVSNTCPLILPGELAAHQCTIGVAFKPTAPGPRKGFLRFQSIPSVLGVPLSGPGCKKVKGKKKLVCKAQKKKKK